MQDWRARYLGLTTIPASLTAEEIDELFTLNGEIAPVVGARRTPLYRHQQAAMAAMGFKEHGEASERALTG